tara:strand:- start:25 stop:981 length:957 start_codon:yes stop_codon:yes gene_type:complete
MIRLRETVYLGCKSTEIADMSNHVILYDKHTTVTHLPIVDRIGYPFWEAQFLYDIGLQKEPIKYCVLVPAKFIDLKVKETNINTKYDTLLWFIKNLHPPACGAILSIYEYDNADTIRNGRYYPGCIWPLNKDRQWIGDGDYITLHSLEPALLDLPVGNIISSHPTQPIINTLESYSPIEIKRIDYTMGEEHIFNLLKHSKLHITYHGATYFSAGMIDIPTICYASEVWPLKVNGNYKDYITGERTRIYIDNTSWNYTNGGSVPTRLHQYSFNMNRAIQAPQRFVKHVTIPKDLIDYVMGIKSLEFFNRTYNFMKQINV